MTKRWFFHFLVKIFVLSQLLGGSSVRADCCDGNIHIDSSYDPSDAACVCISPIGQIQFPTKANSVLLLPILLPHESFCSPSEDLLLEINQLVTEDSVLVLQRGQCSFETKIRNSLRIQRAKLVLILSGNDLDAAVPIFAMHANTPEHLHILAAMISSVALQSLSNSTFPSGYRLDSTAAVLIGKSKWNVSLNSPPLEVCMSKIQAVSSVSHFASLRRIASSCFNILRMIPRTRQTGSHQLKSAIDTIRTLRSLEFRPLSSLIARQIIQSADASALSSSQHRQRIFDIFLEFLAMSGDEVESDDEMTGDLIARFAVLLNQTDQGAAELSSLAFFLRISHAPFSIALTSSSLRWGSPVPPPTARALSQMLSRLSSHSILWMPSQEISYLLSKVSFEKVQEGANWLLLLPLPPPQIFDFLDLFNVSMTKSLSWPSLSSDETWILIDVFTRLAVYWDEVGFFTSSQFAHLSSARLAAQHLLSTGSSRRSLSDLVCLSVRPMAATRTVFSSQDQYRVERNRQCKILSRMLSIIHQNSDVDIAANASTLRFRLLGLEELVTNTLATMMVGYHNLPFHTHGRSVQSGSCESRDATLLGGTHDIIKWCSQPTRDTSYPPSMQKTRNSVAFVSSFCDNHSVGRLILPLVRRLIQSGGGETCAPNQHGESCLLEIYFVHVINLLSSSATCSMQSDFPSAYLPIRVSIGQQDSVHSAIQHLRSFNFNVVVFAEIGMDVASAAIASHRISVPASTSYSSPGVQMVYWGHPIGQGLDSIDYYISSRLFTHNNHDALSRHEQLLLFDGLTTFFHKPQLISGSGSSSSSSSSSGHAQISKLLAQWGAFANRLTPQRVYLLPHTMMKFSTSFDEVILKILERDASGLVVCLINPSQAAYVNTLQRRLFSKTSSALGGRLIFTPRLSQQEYYSLLSTAGAGAGADPEVMVTVLDTFPFGMGVTALEVLAAGLPIVTAPSLQSVVGLAAGMILKLDLNQSTASHHASAHQSSLIVSSIEEYVETALFVSAAHCDLLERSDTCIRDAQSLRQSIARAAVHLFEDTSVVDEWKRLLLRLTADF